MSEEFTDKLGQPIGRPLDGWGGASKPSRTCMEGHYCKVSPLDIGRHSPDLYENFLLDEEGQGWTYLPYGPFPTYEDFLRWIKQTCLSDDPMFHAIIELSTGKAIGIVSLMRINPSIGVIEVGHIHYSLVLQRTTIATEVMYLLMKRVFGELGYRRFEWKCDTLNKRSNEAARRYGFTFEGIFRQATIYKKRNRDTAWYSVLDLEWSNLKLAYESWLSSENFFADGTQRQSLSKYISDCKV